MDNKNNEMNLVDIIDLLWEKKFKILSFTLILSFVIAIYSLTISNKYISSTSLAPVVSKDSQSGNISSSIGSLAGLTGISVGGPGFVDKTTIGLEQLRSRRFVGEFLKKYDLYKDLVASDGWNEKSNTLTYDRKIYSIKNNNWIIKPSYEESYLAFNSIFVINQDLETGVITLSIEHYSPFIAKQWLSWIVQEINSITRVDEIKRAENSLNYLKNEIENTKLTEIRFGLTNLALSQHEKIMIAKVTPEYLFKTIDPPYFPEYKSSPRRSVLTILGFFLGLFLSALYFTFNLYWKEIKASK